MHLSVQTLDEKERMISASRPDDLLLFLGKPGPCSFDDGPSLSNIDWQDKPQNSWTLWKDDNQVFKTSSDPYDMSIWLRCKQSTIHVYFLNCDDDRAPASNNILIFYAAMGDCMNRVATGCRKSGVPLLAYSLVAPWLVGSDARTVWGRAELRVCIRQIICYNTVDTTVAIENLPRYRGLHLRSGDRINTVTMVGLNARA